MNYFSLRNKRFIRPLETNNTILFSDEPELLAELINSYIINNKAKIKDITYTISIHGESLYVADIEYYV